MQLTNSLVSICCNNVLSVTGGGACFITMLITVLPELKWMEAEA